jgi:hypothetical protein
LTLWISRVSFLVVRKLNLLRRFGLPSSLFSPHLCFLLFSFTNFLGLLPLELLFFIIELLFGLLQPFKTVFVFPEILRELVTAVFRTVLVVLFSVNFVCFVKDLFDLVLKLFARSICSQCGVALDASAVQGDFSKVSKAGFSTEAQDFLEQVLEVLTVVFSEVADRAEVRLLIGSKVAEGDVSFKQSIEFAGAADTNSIAEDEDFQHQDGMEGRPPAAVLPGFWIEGIKSAFGVEVVNGVRDESFQAVFLDPVRDVLREEVLLVLVIFNKIMTHRRILST